MPIDARALHRLKIVTLLFSVALLSSSCAQSQPGPGMIVSFSSLIDGRSISVKSITLPSGNAFDNPGHVGGRRSKNWHFGKTSGGSGDGRGLPEWLDFVWQEPNYPGLEPENFATREAFSEAVREMFETLPRRTQRVVVRNRIPIEVVEEATVARVQSAGKLPSKSLWIYFVWTDSGVKLRWSLIEGSSNRLRNGGDELDDK